MTRASTPQQQLLEKAALAVLLINLAWTSYWFAKLPPDPDVTLAAAFFIRWLPGEAIWGLPSLLATGYAAHASFARRAPLGLAALGAAVVQFVLVARVFVGW